MDGNGGGVVELRLLCLLLTALNPPFPAGVAVSAGWRATHCSREITDSPDKI